MTLLLTCLCKSATQRSPLSPASCSHPTSNPSPSSVHLSLPPQTTGPGCHHILSWFLVYPHSCCCFLLSVADLCNMVQEIFSQCKFYHTTLLLTTFRDSQLPLGLAWSSPASLSSALCPSCPQSLPLQKKWSVTHASSSPGTPPGLHVLFLTDCPLQFLNYYSSQSSQLCGHSLKQLF